MSRESAAGPLLPQLCRIAAIREETADMRTFCLQTMAGCRPFSALPGQWAMLSLPGVGEAPFAISAQGGDFLEFTVKRCGLLTEALHECWAGQTIGLRGPYGNHFPLAEAEGQDLLLIGGGVGLAPLRSFILYVLANRAQYGAMDIVCGARTPADLPFFKELTEVWPAEPQTRVRLAAESAADTWAGETGLLPAYVRKLGFSPQNRLALLCGPPAMLPPTMQALTQLGFSLRQMYTTLEMRMSCGIGLCGRCRAGDKHICLDGAVFCCAGLPGGFGE